MAKSTTFQGAAKPFGKSGHFVEPRRHALQAKGIKTGHLAQPLPIPAPKGRLVEVRVFSFDELLKDVQQKVLDEHREINVDYEWYDMDGLVDLSEKDMKEAGIKDSEYPMNTGLIKYNHRKMYFDLDRGQYLQLNDLEVTDENVFRKWLGIPEKLWKKIDYRFINERDNNTYIMFTPDQDLTTEEEDILGGAVEKWSDKMHEAWKMLHDTYESIMEDDAVADTLRANDYEFRADGKMFNRER